MGWIGRPSPSTATTGIKRIVVIVIIVVVASPARTGFRLPIGGPRLATLLAFDALPTHRTSIGTAQPLLEQNARQGHCHCTVGRKERPYLEAAPMEPVGTVGYFQEFVISLILRSRSVNKRHETQPDTHII